MPTLPRPAPSQTIAADHPQVIRLRTFSKGYGLAGARVGYAVTEPDLAQAFDKVRDHFGDGPDCRRPARLRRWRIRTGWPGASRTAGGAAHRLSASPRANGLLPLPSATNFVTIDLGRDGDYARAVLAEMADAGRFHPHAGRGPAGPLHPHQPWR